jgi:hypothetical protein
MAADFAILDVGLSLDRGVQDHGDLLEAVGADEEVLHSGQDSEPARIIVFNETLRRVDSRYYVPRELAAADDPELQFARQLYNACLGRYGQDHEETRTVARYVADLENRNSAGANSSALARETTFVPHPPCIISKA